mmetsp:Transcript_89073/g.157827  ORF Transcript_89073/g.157827 Transcript_89073/m.157827 type:complete len:209 (+) Transcript_89073:1299-1925(+)
MRVTRAGAISQMHPCLRGPPLVADPPSKTMAVKSQQRLRLLLCQVREEAPEDVSGQVCRWRHQGLHEVAARQVLVQPASSEKTKLGRSVRRDILQPSLLTSQEAREALGRVAVVRCLPVLSTLLPGAVLQAPAPEPRAQCRVRRAEQLLSTYHRLGFPQSLPAEDGVRKRRFWRLFPRICGQRRERRPKRMHRRQLSMRRSGIRSELR